MEIQFKMSMILPTKIQVTKKDLEMLFEEVVSLDLANVHYENIELEEIGKIGFVVKKGKNQIDT